MILILRRGQGCHKWVQVEVGLLLGLGRANLGMTGLRAGQLHQLPVRVDPRSDPKKSAQRCRRKNSVEQTYQES